MNLVPRKIFFDDFFDDFVPAFKDNSMKCDIYEKGDKYYIEMDIPGYSKEDIDIDIDNDYITVTASKDFEENDEDKNYIRKERSYSKMSRSFYVGDADKEDIKAEFKNGILKIEVPKQEKVETKKKIEIE